MTQLLQAMAGAAHGGAEAFFERLALALQRAGVEQTALIRTNAKRAALLKAGGVAVEQLPFGGRLDLLTRFGFRRAIHRHRPRVVLTWMSRASRFCPDHGDFVHVGRLGGYYDLKYYRHCRHLIGNTQDIRDWIVAKGWPADRVHYVPNFVDARTAPPLPRAGLDTPPGVPLLLALGRLHPNKAFDVLLHAMPALPDAYLWIAGEGSARAELEALAAHLGVKPRVRFLGWRDDTAALFAACDLFVCPSRHEPLGNVVIEAWAQNRPVVACASQGPRQLVTDGADGLLVPVDDATALAEAIRALLADHDRASAVASAGHASFQARFTEAAVVAQYLEFLAKVSG
jgi:glycosyltransferase involved in cell wall biosynthesis